MTPYTTATAAELDRQAAYAAGTAAAGPFVPETPGREASVRAGLTPARAKRRRREVETDQFAAFVGRILRAFARRVGNDLDALGTLKDMRAELDQAMDDAVARLRNDPDQPASWAEIGAQLGITRQTAQERFAHVGGSRAVGGQPSHLR
jgi:hypothetical protein